KQVLALTDQKPTIVQRVGKNDKTHWVLFIKEA
ncbi:SAM-dependent methyltransferase, partial [Proteus mirabilis]